MCWEMSYSSTAFIASRLQTSRLIIRYKGHKEKARESAYCLSRKPRLSHCPSSEDKQCRKAHAELYIKSGHFDPLTYKPMDVCHCFITRKIWICEIRFAADKRLARVYSICSPTALTTLAYLIPLVIRMVGVAKIQFFVLLIKFF